MASRVDAMIDCVVSISFHFQRTAGQAKLRFDVVENIASAAYLFGRHDLGKVTTKLSAIFPPKRDSVVKTAQECECLRAEDPAKCFDPDAIRAAESPQPFPRDFLRSRCRGTVLVRIGPRAVPPQSQSKVLKRRAIFRQLAAKIVCQIAPQIERAANVPASGAKPQTTDGLIAQDGTAVSDLKSERRHKPYARLWPPRFPGIAFWPKPASTREGGSDFANDLEENVFVIATYVICHQAATPV